MVRKASQITLDNPVNQGVRADIPEPNEIGSPTPYDFDLRHLTAYGGLLPVATMLENLGFRQRRSGTRFHASGAHRVAALLKRWLLGTHQGAVTARHLDAYLNEFAFRFNRRHSRCRGLPFLQLLHNAVVTPQTRYRPSRSQLTNRLRRSNMNPTAAATFNCARDILDTSKVCSSSSPLDLLPHPVCADSKPAATQYF